ncbi:MAG: UGSC family (seleno)protein, partial [Dissulfurispiraceae bacterium]
MSQGVADMSFVVVPHPMGGIPGEEITQKARDAFPAILNAATKWKPVAEMPPWKPTYPAETFLLKGTGDDINTLFFERGWSLGLPLVSPTPEKVREMLKGTSRKPDEVLGQVPPRMGSLTVELVATHAVMAGCKP